MGCGESKDASAAAPRKPAAPPEPKYQAPEVIPAPKPAVVPQPAAAVAASVPTPMSPASMPKRQNQAIYATSTDRRIQEVEFFRNVVKRTEDEFMDVSQSAMDYHDADVSDESGMGAKLRSMAVQPERMDFATMPRPSAKNQENIQSIMAGNGLSPSQLATLDAAASAIASAIEQMSLVDTGKPMVVQFRAA